MRQSMHRYVGYASLFLFTAACFAACGGLDPRKVTKEPGTNTTGNKSSGGSSDPGSGGNDAGGELGNPFGGNLFEGGAPPVLEGPPTVVKVEPADGATDVDVTADVGLLFSEALDPATVTAASVKFTDAGVDVPATLGLVNDIIASFDPERRLALAAKYDVSVSTAVTDSTGVALDAAFASSFTTRDGTWSEVNLPFVDGQGWYSYDEAFFDIDERGNVLVAWPLYDANFNKQIYARWYRQASGWQPITQLSGSESSVGFPSVAVDDEGNAVVVWQQYMPGTSTYAAMARRYINGAWGELPEVASTSLTMENFGSGPFVEMRGGKVIVWWDYRYVSGNFSSYYLYAQATTVGGAWLPNPINIGYANGATQYLGSGRAAMDPKGNAMLVFPVVTSATGAVELQFTKYVASTNDWESSALIDVALNLPEYYAHAVALDDTGAAMVVWRTKASPFNVMASRYTKAKGFAAPAPLDDLDTPPLMHQFSSLVSDGTDFFVSWSQQVGATNNVYGNHYSTADGAWGTAQLLSDGDTSVADAPTTAADRHGNAMSVWLQGNYSEATMYEGVQYRFARWLKGSTAWAKSGLIAGGKNFNRYAPYASAAAGNGIVGLLTVDYGIYHPAPMPSEPGQPLLNIFQ